MARRRFRELPRERRDEILGLAAAEFARTGFHATSYNQLLDRLKLGKSSAYYLFDDKRDLFLTAVEHCYARYFEAIQSLPRPKTAEGFWVFVHKASLMGFEYMLDDPTAAALMLSVQRDVGLVADLGSSDLLASMNAYYAGVLAEGQRLGAVRKDLPRPLLIAAVRNLAVTFDQWFIAERAAAARPPSPASSAKLFTQAARRLVGNAEPEKPSASRARTHA
ncbi:MAG: TetR/AcrR family transcriptional regulator [Labilithrix sp.]|nr:TetR/AcrR family transcriptional regulator [Labilithrix sp.]